MGEAINRILIAAPSSGSGKTTLTCALLEILRRRGRRPVSFKCGPDYIDPMFHRSVLKIPSWNLDGFFTQEEILKGLFQKHARQGDLAVVEGVMGYYDGLGGASERASTYETASFLKAPVILVVDAEKAGKTPAEQIRELTDRHPDHRIAGVILNRISSSLSDETRKEIETGCGIDVLGAIPERPDLVVPSRHLGLHQPEENPAMDRWIREIADLVEEHAEIGKILDLADHAPEWQTVPEPVIPIPEPVIPVRIAVARDEAFSFYYAENEEMLKAMGAELVPFSPMHDDTVPEDVDGIILGGGYPELHAGDLAENRTMCSSVADRIRGGIPAIAECGGFLYLQKIIRKEDNEYPVTGVFPGTGEKKDRLVRFGYMEAETGNASVFGPKGTTLRGHEFHYMDTDCNGEDLLCRKPSSGKEYRTGFCRENLYAGFPHFYYYSCPDAAASFIKACRRYRAGRLARQRWDSMAKPLDGLGLMEEQLIRLARAGRNEKPVLRPCSLVVFCADHGVTEEGVTQTGSEVTRIVAENCAAGRSTVGILAARAGADVYTVDVGMMGPEYPQKELDPGAVISRRIRNGTGNIARGPAMTGEECRRAIQTGREIVRELCFRGTRLLALGEMGIGNTTPTAAVTALFTGKEAEETTGTGAGLSQDGLRRKTEVVDLALRRIRSYGQPDPMKILSEAGGLEIAAMTGALLEASDRDLPVLLDGAVTLAAALAAVRMDPRCADVFIATHIPREPAGQAALRELDLPAVIRGEMALGEGTGGMLLLPMLDSVLEVYERMDTFDQIRVVPYQRYPSGEEDPTC